MGFEGDLKNISLADVFQNIQTNQLSGTLHLTEEEERAAHLFFEDGAVIGFAPGGDDDRPALAEILRAQKAIDEEILSRALEEKGRRELRTHLDSEDILSEEEQRAHVRTHVEEETYELFTWKKAHFRFEDGPPDRDLFPVELEHLKLRIEPTSILMEATRRVDEWERIRRKVPTFKEIYVPTNTGGLDEEFEEVHREVLAAMDGRRDLQAIVDELARGRFDVARATADLLTARHIKPLDTDELKNQADELIRTGNREQAVNILKHALDLERGALDVRRRLIETLEALDRPDAATEQLKQLGYLLLERGDKQEAVEAYRKATELAPSDLSLHERLLELLTELEKPKARLEAGRRMAKAALEQHLYDKAIAVYEDCLSIADEERTAIRLLLARAHIQKTDIKGGVEVLRAEANQLLKEGALAEATQVFRELLDHAPEDEEALKRIEEIESGLYEKRRKRARRLLWLVLGAALFALLLLQGVRETLASYSLRRSYSELLFHIDRAPADGHVGLVQTLGRIRTKWPWTVTSYQVGGLVEEIVRTEVRTTQRLIKSDAGEEALLNARQRLEELHPFLESQNLRVLVEFVLKELPTPERNEAVESQR